MAVSTKDQSTSNDQLVLLCTGALRFYFIVTFASSEKQRKKPKLGRHIDWKAPSSASGMIFA